MVRRRMKYQFLFLLYFVNCSPSAITYDFNGGRFGDCLSTLCKAEFFAHKYKLKLLYKPFIYSDQLAVHITETHYTQELEQQYDKIVYIKNGKDIKKSKHKNILYISNFYSETPGLYEFGLQDKNFGAKLKQILMPIDPPALIEKPEGAITAAVHVRKGGGFDKPLASEQVYKKDQQFADQIWPTKFPPDQYYIDQIKVLRKLIDPEKSLLIYVFTDDPDPAALAARYTQKLNDPTISFTHRQNDNSHDAHVVEDFYLMSQCDCLIRSSSLYAKAAQLLGDHQIIIYPIRGYWKDNLLIIDPVGITLRKQI